MAVRRTEFAQTYSKEPARILLTFHHYFRAIGWENLISRMTMKDVTRIPAVIDQGNAKAANELLPPVYEGLYERTKPSGQQPEHK